LDASSDLRVPLRYHSLPRLAVVVVMVMMMVIAVIAGRSQRMGRMMPWPR